jgi:cytohesin/brefeldin A-inhibited guanine nucleotide-exchange protein
VFKGDFLLRVWDGFLLEGEIYLFKVGIALIKYFEIELKMCTFYEGLKLLKFSNTEKSSLLFFEILDKDIDVKPEHYYEYILKRKHAMVKTKIQSIPLG